MSRKTYLCGSVDLRTLNGTSENEPNLSNHYKMLGQNCENDWNLGKLSKVNIFVGPNNSGKSRFMRKLFSSNQDRFCPACMDIDELSRVVADAHDRISTHLSNQLIELEGGLPDVPRWEYLTTGIPFSSDYEEYRKQLFSRSLRALPQRLSGPLIEVALVTATRTTFTEMLAPADELIEAEKRNNFSKPKLRKRYIPAVRGLRRFSTGDGDEYLELTRKEYFPGRTLEGEMNTIFTGISLYHELQRMLLGDLKERSAVREFENYLGEEYFDNQAVTLIPSLAGDLNVKIGNEKEQPIHHLGDGLQQLIIMTFAAFSAQDGFTNIYIEEPELFLHPAMQRRLLEMMTCDRFPKVQFYCTTHSNHLLDMVMDYNRISVYRIRKVLGASDEQEILPNFTVTNVNLADLTLLADLGVQSSSVFLTNCTVWVEGITDRLYLRHYLNLYKAHLETTAPEEQSPRFPREDFEYAFVEYGGGNITHWSFLGDANSINVKRLCSRVILIADRDCDKKRPRHDKLEAILGDRFLPLPCREIENLISKDVLIAVVKGFEGANSSLNESFTEEDYRSVYLGDFIEDTILNGGKQRKGSYKGSSGTINQKVKFQEKVLHHTDTYEKLSEAARAMVRDLAEAISSACSI